MDIEKAIDYLYRQMELGRIENDTEQEDEEKATREILEWQKEQFG